MKLFIAFLVWCILLAICWPLALLTLILFPLVWLVALPFRLLTALVEGCLALIKAILFLPARLLGLADRGHLGPGARADVALYQPAPEGAPAPWPTWVGRCRTLLKGGVVVVKDFSLIRPEVPRATCYRRTGAEPTALADELCQYRSFRQENLWVPEDLEGAAWAGV